MPVTSPSPRYTAEVSVSRPTQPPSTFHRALRLFGRALLLRCPECGSGGIFRNWLSQVPVCPGCGRRFEREEGYFLGAMAVNLIVAELIPTAAAVLTLVLTWPNPPWTVLQFALPIAMAVVPLLFFPFSRLVWVALDWSVRPMPPGETDVDHPRPGTPAADSSGSGSSIQPS